jgi:hypothetical protein
MFIERRENAPPGVVNAELSQLPIQNAISVSEYLAK